jgi:redox-sensing transcriptional repressor
MAKSIKIPKATITRLSLYYRQLELLEFDGYRMVSSEKLAWLCQVNPAQVRKDLGYFGEFGVRGVGYDVIDLQVEIKKILAVNRDWNICIVGFGNLGSAIMQHQNLPARGFRCVAVFDNDSKKIGGKTPIGLKIMDVRDLVQVVKDLNIEIGVITTISSAAQSVADLFLKANVHAIINFSPGMVRVPDYCVVENIDFTIKLDMLTFNLRQRTAPTFTTN